MISKAAGQGCALAGARGSQWDLLPQREQEPPTFKAAHSLYYLGGLIGIGAMTLLMTL